MTTHVTCGSFVHTLCARAEQILEQNEMTGDFSLIAKSIDFLQALENAKIAFMDVSNHDLTSLDSDLAMIY